MTLLKSLTGKVLTLSEVLVSLMNWPSVSVSETSTGPLADEDCVKPELACECLTCFMLLDPASEVTRAVRLRLREEAGVPPRRGVGVDTSEVDDRFNLAHKNTNQIFLSLYRKSEMHLRHRVGIMGMGVNLIFQ